MEMKATVLTAGHSNHGYQRFEGIIKSAGAQKILDCRSAPYSKRLPHFNRRPLQMALAAADVEYEWLGQALGGRPEGPHLYTASGKANYPKMAAQPDYLAAIDTVTRATRTRSVMLLCTEEDPVRCHRALMIAETLSLAGYEIVHIRASGEHITHDQMLESLKSRHATGDRDTAILRQAAQAAYRKPAA